MGAGTCVGDARGRMRQGLPSMPDRAIGGARMAGPRLPRGTPRLPRGGGRAPRLPRRISIWRRARKGSRARGQPWMEAGAAGGLGRGCHGLVTAAMAGSFVDEICGGFGRPARFAASAWRKAEPCTNFECGRLR
jgi:hypothetical protein